MVKPEKGKALLEKVKTLMGNSGIEKPVTGTASGVSLERKIKEEKSKIQKDKKRR